MLESLGKHDITEPCFLKDSKYFSIVQLENFMILDMQFFKAMIFIREEHSFGDLEPKFLEYSVISELW